MLQVPLEGLGTNEMEAEIGKTVEVLSLLPSPAEHFMTDVSELQLLALARPP